MRTAAGHWTTTSDLGKQDKDARHPYSLAATQVDDDFLLLRLPFKKLPDHPINGSHAKPVSSVDSGRSAYGFPDKIAVEMRLGQIELLYTSLGNNTAVVRLQGSISEEC
jgi:hypothetical protein